MTFENQTLETIFRQFDTQSIFAAADSVKTGHINDSYHIKCSGYNDTGYFLQKINTNIFKDVKGLMANICAVTEHLGKKLQDDKNLQFSVLEVIRCRDGKPWFQSSDGNCWRLFRYISGMHSYDLVENTKIAYEGGKAFGIFMSLLADLPAVRLIETIPDFHHMGKRLEAFERSATDDIARRVSGIKPEIDFLRQRASEMMKITQLIASGKIPSRITHNDTKFNNILFDAADHAMAIVDLDTVMPGSVLFDFGDAIRTGANTAMEDEQDLTKVNLNLPIYKAYTDGFIKSTFSKLTDTEAENLAFSARFMTFIIGLRFLTDYLNGDTYFRTNYDDHNLVRSRVQFRLIEKMEKSGSVMNEIVRKSLNKYRQIK